MSIGTRIKELRDNLGLTQEALALKVGVTKGAIANYEKEVSIPKPEIMYKLFSALNCDANYLYQDDIKSLSYINDIYSIEEKKIIEIYRMLDKFGKSTVQAVINSELERINENTSHSRLTRFSGHYTYSMPYYSIPVSAGTGEFLDSEHYEMLDLIEQPPVEANFIVRVSGNSMEPTYCDGDKLFIKQQPNIEIGEIGIFMIDGDVFVKELAADGLISHNPKYKKIKFNEYENIRCYGKVIGKVDN